jgi:hypothetical protein
MSFNTVRDNLFFILAIVAIDHWFFVSIFKRMTLSFNAPLAWEKYQQVKPILINTIFTIACLDQIGDKSVIYFELAVFPARENDY